MNVIALLNELRSFGGKAVTTGLADNVIERFADRDPKLVQAIEEAVAKHKELRKDFSELLARDEMDLVHGIQQDFVNFYADDVVNPYVPLAARGPWIVTSKGAVVHDSGGYGMLGLGHAPDAILEALNRPQVIANVMTASVSQLRMTRALKNEIGQTRGTCPFDKFLFMNSGSEAVTVAARISDVNAKLMTDPDGRYVGRKIKKLVLSGAFHGRTDRPARYSDSTRATYTKYLASFRGLDDLI